MGVMLQANLSLAGRAEAAGNAVQARPSLGRCGLAAPEAAEPAEAVSTQDSDVQQPWLTDD